VVFLGDYVDRGQDSAKVIRRLMDGPKSDAWLWRPLCGNHEEMMFTALVGKEADSTSDLAYSMWVNNGGQETMNSYYRDCHDLPLIKGSSRVNVEEAIEWVSTLTTVFVDDHRVYVHAMVDENYDLDKHPQGVLLWGRYAKNQNEGYRGLHVVHGHTPFKNGPILLSNRSNLDVGAYATGRICVAVFDDDLPGGPIEILEIHANK
jgi:serine/threonine protein phosphatase 1